MRVESIKKLVLALNHMRRDSIKKFILAVLVVYILFAGSQHAKHYYYLHKARQEMAVISDEALAKNGYTRDYIEYIMSQCIQHAESRTLTYTENNIYCGCYQKLRVERFTREEMNLNLTKHPEIEERLTRVHMECIDKTLNAWQYQ